MSEKEKQYSNFGPIFPRNCYNCDKISSNGCSKHNLSLETLYSIANKQLGKISDCLKRGLTTADIGCLLWEKGYYVPDNIYEIESIKNLERSILDIISSVHVGANGRIMKEIIKIYEMIFGEERIVKIATLNIKKHNTGLEGYLLRYDIRKQKEKEINKNEKEM